MLPAGGEIWDIHGHTDAYSRLAKHSKSLCWTNPKIKWAIQESKLICILCTAVTENNVRKILLESSFYSQYAHLILSVARNSINYYLGLLYVILILHYDGNTTDKAIKRIISVLSQKNIIEYSVKLESRLEF